MAKEEDRTPEGSQSPEPAKDDDGRFKCAHCNQTYTRQHNLKSHMLTHSKEKPYSCSQCNVRFRRLHDLKRHNKLHTGEKPHTCERCGRKFARTDALVRHIRVSGLCGNTKSPYSGDSKRESSRRQATTPSEGSPVSENTTPKLPPISENGGGSSSTDRPVLPPLNIGNHSSSEPWTTVRMLEARMKVLENRLVEAEGRIAYLEAKQPASPGSASDDDDDD